MAWFNDSWQYRSRIDIDNTVNSSDLTNFQIKIEFNSSNFDFSKAKSDGSDIRVCDSDETTLISFWIEKWDSSAQEGIVWVKVPSIPASTTKSIYVYYGNPDATSISSLTDTFIAEISGLDACWHLDEGSGDTAYDTSGNGHDFTLYNSPTWITDGKYGNAINLDSSLTQYLRTSYKPDFVSSGFSAEVWFRTTTTGQNMYLLNQWGSGGTGNASWGIYVYNDNLNGYVYDGSSSYGISVPFSSYADGNWHHAVLTFDGTTVSFYVDGILIGSTNGVCQISTNYDITLGRTANDVYEWNGDVDEARFYNRALTSDEVSNLYNKRAYATPNYPNKVLLREPETDPSISVATIESLVLSIELSDTLTLSDSLYSKPAKKAEIEETLNLSDLLEQFKFTLSKSEDITLSDSIGDENPPEIKYLNAYQVIPNSPLEESRVEITFDFRDFKSPDLLITALEYWDNDSSSWVACSNYSPVEIHQDVVGGWKTATITWSSKSQLDGRELINTKIRLTITDFWNSTTVISNNFNIDHRNPVITSVSPTGEIKSRLPLISVDVEELQDCFVQVKISTDKLIWDSGTQPMIRTGANTHHWEYKFDEHTDDYLPAFGYFTIEVTVTDQYGNSTTQNYEFNTIPADIEIETDQIYRRFDGSNIADVQIRVRSLNEDRIDLRFFWKRILELNNYKEGCYIVETDKGIIEDNWIKGIKTEGSEWVTVNLKWKYNSEEQTNLLNQYNQQKIEVESKVLVSSDGSTWIDLSKFVESYSINDTESLVAREANITFKGRELSPFLDTDLNSNGILLSYGNRIVIKQLTKIGDNIEEVSKFSGVIASVEINGNEYNVVAYDRLRVLTQTMLNNLKYSPQVNYVQEELTSLDGLKWESSNSNWAKFPPPKILVNGEELKNGEYSVDYLRGIVYIFKNLYLVSEQKTTVINANDVPDRKTFVLNFNIDSSVETKVYHLWEEKIVEYSCIGKDLIEPIEYWVQKSEQLTEEIDFYIDYGNDSVILSSALPEDNDTQRNHRIKVEYRARNKVIGQYYYYEPGTNEVEDIIEDLLSKCNFSTDELRSTITEKVYSNDGYNFWLSKNNDKTYNQVKVNGNSVSFSEIDQSSTYKKKGYLSFNKFRMYYDKLLDPVNSTKFWSFNNASAELIDDDYRYPDRSLKIIFGSGGSAELDFSANYRIWNLNIYNRLAFYVKANRAGTITIKLKNPDKSSVATFSNIDVSTSWDLKILDISEVSFKSSIGYLEILGDDIIVYFDYIHIPEDDVEVTYTYGNLQATGITINELIINYENYDTIFDAIEDIMRQVSPNYTIYIDNDGKVKGEYQRVRWSALIIEGFNNTGLSNIHTIGRFLLEDFILYHNLENRTEISDEEVYTGIVVIGKLSEKNNVAMFGTATNQSSITPAQYGNYGRVKAQIIQSLSNYNRSGVLYFLKQLIDQDPQAVGGDLGALIDADVNTGAYWHYVTTNPDDRPEPHKIVTIELPEPIYWEEITICIGAYQNKIIREEIYIEVETEDGYTFFPEGETPNYQQGNTGNWLKFSNTYMPEKKITKVHIYLNTPFYWIVAETRTGGKK